MIVGLNPHLINLMTIRERQRLDAPAAATRRPDGAPVFTSALDDSMAPVPTAASGEAKVLAVAGEARADAVRHMAQSGTSAVDPSLTPQKILNPQNLVSRFLGEQDLVLAAQRAPDSRYRNTPDDDTSGERETQANLRPVD
ncbi:hypothetical protein HN371_14280 [Candidatus Poribacteria bacterium]|jgi:hypothetical protein|nr:hypothetical protein [Candidatus Poribacteria bacterium]MBT5536273.1 hypothetical protein [Candidatus Poribacteria bacterium]MBT7100714.1 hypothetical protein [Candidatus Poribacteria bacterium]MBT7806603.1 hypothetical protein [Candidatus Poribacteria bacterium]